MLIDIVWQSVLFLDLNDGTDNFNQLPLVVQRLPFCKRTFSI